MQDFLIDDDILIQGGDLVIGNSDRQHQKHILIAQKGEYRQFPELGVGINNILSGEDATKMLIEAKRNFEYDRMKVKELRFTEENTLIINAPYTE
ncbi:MULTISPECIES: hypothetical protein [Sphingobacterium]|uniref:hypothetical protein n=1 Tax=Sphingobacterium TaxID=28453 RepID=UPI00257EC0F2|nr:MULTISPECIES: hypothetical protein [Sphingobacterium]